MINVVDIGDGVPDSSGKREKNRWQRLSCNTLSCVACEICIWLCEKFGDFGDESLESHCKAW